MSHADAFSPLGIIAGGDELPLIAAAAARRFRPVMAIRLAETRCKKFGRAASEETQISLSKTGQMRQWFKERGVEDILIIGKVDKKLHFKDFEFDALSLTILQKLQDRSDASLKYAIFEALENEGFHILSQIEFLSAILAKEGLNAGPMHPPDREESIKRGVTVARALAELDAGQTVIIKAGAIIALEAFEHTDKTILRAGKLAGPGCTVIKVARPSQDPRWDVPAVGPKTLRVMSSVGADVLAVEADKVLLHSKDKFISEAERLGISVMGIKVS